MPPTAVPAASTTGSGSPPVVVSVRPPNDDAPVVPAKVPTVGARAPWRLRVVGEPPFTAATIAGHTFHVFTEPVIPDPQMPEGYRRDRVVGIIEPLTDDEVARIRTEMAATFVRWENRKMRIGHIFKPRDEPGLRMDSLTDEPIGKYLRMERVETPTE